jgi:hypothetical protein
MDPAWFEDLSGRLMGLLIALEDRLEETDARRAHEFIDVGEYGLALEEMACALAHGSASISNQERSDMLALNNRMMMDDRVPRALQLCPDPAVSAGPDERPLSSRADGADWDKEMMP